MSASGLLCYFICDTCGNEKNLFISPYEAASLEKAIGEMYTAILNTQCVICNGKYVEVNRDYL